MTEPDALSAAQDPLSGQYEQVLHWTVKGHRAQAIWFQLLGIPVFLLLGLAFANLAIHIGNLPVNATIQSYKFD